MRYQRLILEAGSNAVTVRFHPNLTVVAGVGRLERESLVGELLGSLAGTRRGTHVELTDDAGRRLAVLRHATAPDRVMELESGSDVTAEVAGPDGKVDLLRTLGLDLEGARRRCRLSAADMAVASLGDALANRLAALDQDRLWAAAERVRAADDRLKAEAEGIGATAEDAPVIEEIERRHQAFEAAQARHESFRHHSMFIAGACALGAVPALFLNRLTALPFVAVATVTMVLAVRYRRRLESARVHEQEALAAAGAESYLGFHLSRINTMLQGGDRQRLADAAAEHREAVEAWKAIAGDVAVDWALGSREKITAAAERIRGGGDRAAGPVSAEPAELAHTLILRLNELRHAGSRGESVPLILDEPLEGLEPSVKRWMLELIGRSSGSPQVVYLTDDDDVAAWARMEAVAGHLSVIEPAPEHEAPGSRV